MATSDITALVIEVKSTGVREASNSLGGLSTSAESATKRVDSLTAAMDKLNAMSRITASATSQTSALSGALKQVAASQEGVTAGVSASTGAMKTWQEFIKGKMGPAMREFAAEGVSHAEAHTKAIRRIADEWKVYKATGVSAQAAVNGAGGNLTASLSISKQKLIEQRREMENYNASSRAYSQAHAEAIKMNALFNAQQTAGSGAIGRNAAEIHRHNNAMREARGLARGLSGSLGALWMTYGAFTGLAVGIAIGASLKGIVTIGKDVEHTLEGIRVRGNETVKSIDAIRESVFELGKGVYGPQEVAKAFETLILAGLKAEQALSSINAALNLATVGGVSIEKAATTLVSVGTAIGFTAEGFNRVADVIAKTAALSMSSVETLSEAFKSASSVNRLYGVSLEDIGTSLGVLSNLGIQGSAAGTALKNFYKEMASESPKVVETLKQIGVSQKDLKDSAGNFKPLLDVVATLDAGLKKLDGTEQKLAQSRTSNERGQRLYTQLLGEFNTTLADGSNALQRFRDNVENSYGFAAKGAVQMALTAKSQIDSMFNTLKTSFAETFSSIQPEVIAFSARMKAVFASKEFRDGLITLAQGFAQVALAIAENIPLLTKLAIGLIAVKGAMIGAAVWQAAASGIALVTASATAFAAGTLTLTAALGPLAIVLGVVTAAVIAYNMAMGEDAQKSSKDAQAFANGYIDGLNKQSEGLEKVNQKMRDKKTLVEAIAELERDESKQKMVTLDNKAIVEAEANLKKTTDHFSFNKTKQLLDQAAAQVALDAARKKAVDNIVNAEAAEKKLFTVAKENADLAKAQADAKRTQGEREGNLKLAVKPNTQAANDNYNTTLTRIRGDIEAGKRELTSIEAVINSQFKAGLITEFDQIDKISEARIEKLTTNVRRYQQMIDTAAPANKKNVQALVQNDLNAARYAVEDEAANKHNQQIVAFERIEEDSFLNRQKRLTLEGHNEEAAVEKSARLFDKRIVALQNFLDKELLVNDALESGDAEKVRRVRLASEALTSLQERSAAGIADGKMTDATDATNKALNKMKTEIDGIIAAVPSGGLFAGLAADQEIDRLKAKTIPALEKLYQVQLKLAQQSNAPGDIKAAALTAEEIRKVQKSIAGNDSWAGAQESIRKYGEEAAQTGSMIGNVMTNAFKGAEDALVSFVQTGKLDFKSLADSIIADMLRMQVRQMMGGAMGGAGNSLMGAAVSGLMQGYGSFATMNAGVAASQGLSIGTLAGAFADGGDPPVGKPSLVGEVGPEIFVPKTAGTILPNSVLQGLSGNGGNTTTVTYAPNITIDSRSDAAQVRQMVTAAVRQGNSELVESLSRQGRI